MITPVVRRMTRAMLQAVGELVLPRVCLTCDRLLASEQVQLVCSTCWARVAILPHPRCDRCGHPTGEGSCRWCPLLPPYVRAARSWCWVPGGVAERLLYAFKYEGWHAAGVEMGERMSRLAWPEDVLAECCALIPVPLNEERRRSRGFNQSEVLAHALGHRKGIPVMSQVMQRVRATPSQTRLTPEQRLRNVVGAFQTPKPLPSQLLGAHVMLVDDVITTAATLNECAATLWDAGVRIVSYVSFGRARAAGDMPLTRGLAQHGT